MELPHSVKKLPQQPWDTLWPPTPDLGGPAAPFSLLRMLGGLLVSDTHDPAAWPCSECHLGAGSVPGHLHLADKLGSSEQPSLLSL